MQRWSNCDGTLVSNRLFGVRRLLGTGACLLLCAGGATSALAISSVDRWETNVGKGTVPQEQEMQAAGVTGWNIPVGPTGIRAIITEQHPAFFTVRYVYKNSPAYGNMTIGLSKVATICSGL